MAWEGLYFLCIFIDHLYSVVVFGAAELQMDTFSLCSEVQCTGWASKNVALYFCLYLHQ